MPIVLFEDSDIAIEVRVTKIGRNKALEMLEKSTGFNRKLSHAVVRRYAADMLAGHWRPVPHGIVFATHNGQEILIDGQHRLHAIVQSGVEIEMIVTRGWIASQSFPAIDAGKKKDMYIRTGTDKRLSDVISFLNRLHGGTADAPSLERYSLMSSVVSGDAAEFVLENKTSKAVLTTAPIRSAFAMAIIMGVKKKDATSMYRMFYGDTATTGNEHLDRARLAILRADRRATSSEGARIEDFARVLWALTRCRRFTTNAQEEVVSVVRDIISKMLEKAKNSQIHCE